MRIYNGKNSFIDLPLTNRVRLKIPAHSVSREFMPSDEFLKMIAAAYRDTDIALVVSGPYELNLCAKHPVVTPMISYSLDEAVIKFNGPSKEELTKEEEEKGEALPEPEPVIEVPVEEPLNETEEESGEEEKPKKKRKRKE